MTVLPSKAFKKQDPKTYMRSSAWSTLTKLGLNFVRMVGGSWSSYTYTGTPASGGTRLDLHLWVFGRAALYSSITVVLSNTNYLPLCASAVLITGITNIKSPMSWVKPFLIFTRSPEVPRYSSATNSVIQWSLGCKKERTCLAWPMMIVIQCAWVCSCFPYIREDHRQKS